MEGDDSTALLQTHNLSVTYESVGGDVRALSDVSFKVGQKEFVAIVGESGAGKSTLALAIIGLLGNTTIKGDIIYRGKDLSTLSRKEWNKYRGTEIGMIFQEPLSSLNPIEKIGNQIDEAIKIGKSREGLKKELRVHNYSPTGLVSSMPQQEYSHLVNVPGLSRASSSLKPEAKEEVLQWFRKVRIPDPENAEML